MVRRINGILFDLGNTLLDFGDVDVPALFEQGAKLAYEYLEQLGQPLPAFKYYHRFQRMAVWWRYFVSHITKRDFNALDLIGHLSDRLGHDLTKEQMVELAWQWYKPVGQCATTEPGLRETMSRLRENGLKLGLVSNTFIPSEVLDRHLRNIDLIDLLPWRVYSCDFGLRKPHREIFGEALNLIELPARQVMFVGDSLHCDIHGANRMGMVSVLKDPLGRRRHWWIRARHRIRRIGELPGIIARYNAAR